MNNYFILNRLFSKSMFEKILRGKETSFYNEVVNRYCSSKDITTGEVFRHSYSLLRKHYMNEYFYKNALLNNIIIKRHKLGTTRVLTELSVGNSIADFVTINGKCVAYEIKTELDVLDRIETQIYDYYKCFPYVCVVASHQHLAQLKEKYKDTNVGLYYFDEKGKMVFEKEPEADYSYIDKKEIFKILRKYEYESILKRQGFRLPNVPRVNYYSECLKMFETIDIYNILDEFLIILKQRKKAPNELYKRVPYELKMMVYQLDFDDNDYELLFSFLNSYHKKVGDNNVFSLS